MPEAGFHPQIGAILDGDWLGSKGFRFFDAAGEILKLQKGIRAVPGAMGLPLERLI